MMDFLAITLMLVIISITFYGIVKKFDPVVVLFASGLLLVCCAYALNLSGAKELVENGQGAFAVDLFYLITSNFKDVFSTFGMYVLTIGAYAAFIEKAGAARTMVYYATRPLGRFKNPYVLMVFAFYIGVGLNTVIDSAAGLGLILVTTMYPILRKLGATKLAAASVVATTGSFAISPLSSMAAFNSDLLGIDIGSYFYNYKVLTTIPIVLFCGLSHGVWHWYKDRGKQDVLDHNDLKSSELKPDSIPLMLIPVLPILALFLPQVIPGIKLDISTVMFASVFLSLILVAIIKRPGFRELIDLGAEYFNGMAKVINVVILIVAGQVFANGLMMMGGVEYLVGLGKSIEIGGIGISLMFSAVSFVLSILTGSSNAVVFVFGELSPVLAEQFATPLLTFLLPLHDIAILGRPMAPIAGVVIAVAGVTGIDIIELAKRNAVPMISTAFFAFIINLVMIPILV